MKRYVMILTLATISLFAWQTARACTGIRLTAKDGAVVVARTLEFGADLQSKVVIYPAGTPMSGSLPNSAAGIAFTTKYGIVGANAFGLPMVVDGLNDQGLYVGEFFFPGSAGYTRRHPGERVARDGRLPVLDVDPRQLRQRRRRQSGLRSRGPRADRSPATRDGAARALSRHRQDRRLGRDRTDRRKARDLRRSAWRDHELADVRLAYDQPANYVGLSADNRGVDDACRGHDV